MRRHKIDTCLERSDQRATDQGFQNPTSGAASESLPALPPLSSPHALQHPYPVPIPSTPHCSRMDFLPPRGHLLNQALTGSK